MNWIVFICVSPHPVRGTANHPLCKLPSTSAQLQVLRLMQPSPVCWTLRVHWFVQPQQLGFILDNKEIQQHVQRHYDICWYPLVILWHDEGKWLTHSALHSSNVGFGELCHEHHCCGQISPDGYSWTLISVTAGEAFRAFTLGFIITTWTIKHLLLVGSLLVDHSCNNGVEWSPFVHLTVDWWSPNSRHSSVIPDWTTLVKVTNLHC